MIFFSKVTHQTVLRYPYVFSKGIIRGTQYFLGDKMSENYGMDRGAFSVKIDGFMGVYFFIVNIEYPETLTSRSRLIDLGFALSHKRR